MMTVNVKINFVYGWFSFRTISVYADNKLCDTINASGHHTIQISNNTKELKFQLGKLYPYRTIVSLVPEDYETDNIFVGLSLHYRGLLFSLYDSLKTNYLQSKKLSLNEYRSFNENSNQKELIVLKNSKTSLLMFLISLIILVCSVVQQNNDLSPFAFLIGLSSLITSLVYYKEQKVEKNTYKARVISSVLLFVLATYFLENSYMFLCWIILIFTILLVFFFIENLRNNENTNLREA